MQYYSIKDKSHRVTLQQALAFGIAPDGSLYMPESLPCIPRAFFNNCGGMTLEDIGYVVANLLFGDEVESGIVKHIVDETFNFTIPFRHMDGKIWCLDLSCGPTYSFKDVGARFMSRLLKYFIDRGELPYSDVNIIAATSGDMGPAVVNGFANIPGIKVYVLYPKGMVNKMQELQLSREAPNIVTIEVQGSYDDCHNLIKEAITDPELRHSLRLTTANSVNVARLLPQVIYFMYCYSQLMQEGVPVDKVVIAVPSGNLGSLTAGLMAKRMGLPVKRFIASNNMNDTFCRYLQTGTFQPAESVSTIANAMDIGNPTNFERIMDLYKSDHEALVKDVAGASYTDEEIAETMKEEYERSRRFVDPNGCTAYRALKEQLAPDETGVFLETAHPAKFRSVIRNITGAAPELPVAIKNAAHFQSKRPISMAPKIESLKRIVSNT